jgi:hypothetical protein
MRIVATIKERMECNAQQRRHLRASGVDHDLPRKQQIYLEYLRIEAQTYEEILGQLRGRRWYWPKSKRVSLGAVITVMSLYVMGIFYMFKEMDLSKVEQWQFAVATLPFWIIMVLVPIAVISFMTSRNFRF